jgi:hypothetical protein
MLYDT